MLTVSNTIEYSWLNLGMHIRFLKAVYLCRRAEAETVRLEAYCTTMKKEMALKQLYLITVTILICLLIAVIHLQNFPRQGGPRMAFTSYEGQRRQQKTLPYLELAVRMNSNPASVTVYKGWFVRSLQLFWPEKWLHLTLILDEENKLDHVVGRKLSRYGLVPKLFT